jgi:hypothetical protein
MWRWCHIPQRSDLGVQIYSTAAYYALPDDKKRYGIRLERHAMITRIL